MTSTLLGIVTFIGGILTLLLILSIRGVRETSDSRERDADRRAPDAGPTRTPRLLVAIDGSPSSAETLAEVSARSWPQGSEIEVVTVVHSAVPFFPDPAFSLVAAHVEDERRQTTAAPALLEKATERLRAGSPGVAVSSKALEGDPARAIVDEAERMGADEIFVGCHGHGAIRRGVMGSVSQQVAHQAHCSVHIVRPSKHPAATPFAA